MSNFPENAPSANPVFYRTYSRRKGNGKENWNDVVERCVDGLSRVGNFTTYESVLVESQMKDLHSLPSGRWLWVGGTPWIEKQKNFSGAYNCTSTDACDLESFPLQMALLMMGSGTGAILEPRCIDKLPKVSNSFDLEVLENIGEHSGARNENTGLHINEKECAEIIVGDSREGWVDAFLVLLRLATGKEKVTKVTMDLSHVRPPNTPIKGFGGVANPVKLAHFYRRTGEILRKAYGRKLTSVECCLLLDESSLAVVAGNVRRSAGMRQFDNDDQLAAVAKDNLWQQGEDGKWRIDPERDALRMANHTRVFHRKPAYQEVEDAVRKQFYSGEGAIQYAPEALARSNRDLLNTPERRQDFLTRYEQDPLHGQNYLWKLDPDISGRELEHRMGRYGLNPCGEILGKDFHCNLSEVHLNTLDPNDFRAQDKAFRAAATAAAALLHHEFSVERYRYSREVDPIVGVSFTGLFDFFVMLFGHEWLEWWAEGRPDNLKGHLFAKTEAEYLTRWKNTVEKTVKEYCEKHDLRVPNRTTTVQPAGTKSLLTGASPGWHPPKAARFIRRITFAKNDPVALACEAYGYKIIPSQSDRDETGALLDDPRDPRCTEWLVEIPTETSWANMPGCDSVDVNAFSVEAQYKFYMQVQTYYTTHNTSATLEFREDEIETLSKLIFNSINKDEGYISAALLARFDANETFPRLPFEPITKEQYDQLQSEVSSNRVTSDFSLAMEAFGSKSGDGQGPAACDSDKCLFAETSPK
jgi:ribonucleotide reductase class II